MGMTDSCSVRASLHYDPESGVFTWRLPHKKASNIRGSRVAGSLRKDGYVAISVSGNVYLAHRLAWFYIHGEWPVNLIDHINGVKSDNRICNLRDVSNTENQQNITAAQADSKTGVRGVHFDQRRKKFVASIRADGKKLRLGQFDSVDAAQEARAEAEKMFFSCKRQHEPLPAVEFEAHVRRFMASDRTHREHLSNFALGIAGESGEVVELIKKHLYHGKPLDTEKLAEEIGGLLWYVQAMCVEGGITLADAMAYNQEQLEARHEGQSFRVDKVDNGKGGGSSGAPAQPFCASYFPELVTTPSTANEDERPVIVKGPPLSSYLTVTDNYGERSKYPGNTANQFPVGDIGYRSPVAHRAYVNPPVRNVIVNGDYVN